MHDGIVLDIPMLGGKCAPIWAEMYMVSVVDPVPIIPCFEVVLGCTSGGIPETDDAVFASRGEGGTLRVKLHC